MGFFDKHEPVILKESSSAKAQLEALESLRGTLPANAEKQLEKEIRTLEAGIKGEQSILFELKNSHMDMYVLHDLFLEHNGLTAQIDFLVLTPQRFFVLESKQLYGDIRITERGEFIRRYKGGGEEGFYSPVTQNQRHIDLIHAMKRDSRGALLNLLVDKDFDDVYRSLIVLANAKTVIDDRAAPEDVRCKIIRADQLVSTIKAINGEKGAGRDKTAMSAIHKNAEWFLAQHKENPVDYVARFLERMGQPHGVGSFAADACGMDAITKAGVRESGFTCDMPASAADVSPAAKICPRCGAELVIRTATRGARKGKQFYGCSSYPRCGYILNID